MYYRGLDTWLLIIVGASVLHYFALWDTMSALNRLEFLSGNT